jgi:hypothetical protein
MPLKLLSSGGGSVLLTANTTAADFTVNVPAVNGNMVTTADTGSITQSMLGAGVYAGYGPAFSAYASVAVSLTAGAFTKVGLQTEEFDTANCFDSTTNYRFTPNVAGYYQISAAIQMEVVKILVVSLAKNGSEYKRGIYTNPNTTLSGSVSALIYLNGSTDYVELWGYNGTAGATNTQVGQPYTWMTGFLARAA